MEPGEDRRAAKDIRRRKKIEGLEKKIGRVYAPANTVKKMLPKAGDILGDSEDSLFFAAEHARQSGNLHAWKLLDREDEAMHTYPPPGVRVSVFPNRGKENGKEGNGWVYVVRRELTDEQREVTTSELKYPGYLLIKLRYDEEVHHLVTGCRGVIGFLPVMPVLPRKPTKDQLKAREAWKPIALPDEKAAELLIEQQAENAKRRKKEVKKPVLNYGVGTEVMITSGAFENLVGPVTEIGGDEMNPLVKVKVPLYGIGVEVAIPHNHLKPNK